MKITIYELLGLIKDGKAPEKIRYRNKMYYFRYSTNYKNYDYTDDFDYLFSEGIINNTMLNDEVEIIEEDKGIEKLKIKNVYKCDDYQHIHINFKVTWNKINELIDEINKLNKN